MSIPWIRYVFCSGLSNWIYFLKSTPFLWQLHRLAKLGLLVWSQNNISNSTFQFSVLMIVLKTVSKDIHLLGKKTAANWNKVSITVQFSPWFARTKHLNNISSQRRFLENEQNLDIDKDSWVSQLCYFFFFMRLKTPTSLKAKKSTMNRCGAWL